MNMPTFEAWRWGLLTNTMQPSVVAMVMLLMNLPQCGSSREAKLPPTRPCGAARRRCGFWPVHRAPATCGSRPKVPFRSVPQVFSLWGRSPQACASVAMALSWVLGSFGGLSHTLPRACKATSGLQRGQSPRRGLTRRQRPCSGLPGLPLPLLAVTHPSTSFLHLSRGAGSRHSPRESDGP